MDQTQFSKDQELINPPIKVEPPNPVTDQELSAPVAKKIKPIYLLIIGLVVVTVLVVVGFSVRSSMIYQDNQDTQSVVQPTPLPQNPQTPVSEMGARLLEIEEQINQADPSQIDLEPPPLNYQIRL